MQRLATAKDLGLSNVSVNVGPYVMALNASSREGWWRLENDLMNVTIDEGSHLDGWGLTVKLRAMTLADRGAKACAVLAAAAASEMLHLVEGERIAWIDLCADFSAFDIETADPSQWVTSGSASVKRLAPEADLGSAEYFLSGERVAYYVGRGDVVFRAYDKTVELARDVVGEKRDAEVAAWRAAGWNGTERVTRIEFQVRGAILKELDGGRLRDTGRFSERLDWLWSYLTRQWLRLGVVGSATRRSRWRTDERWCAVQSVVFNAPASVPRRMRARGVPRTKFVASIGLTYAARSGMLDGWELPREREVAAWAPSHARDFVKTTLGALLGTVGDRLAHDLLHTRGATRAAMMVTEYLAAARAKAWTDDGERGAFALHPVEAV